MTVRKCQSRASGLRKRADNRLKNASLHAGILAGVMGEWRTVVFTPKMRREVQYIVRPARRCWPRERRAIHHSLTFRLRGVSSKDVQNLLRQACPITLLWIVLIVVQVSHRIFTGRSSIPSRCVSPSFLDIGPHDLIPFQSTHSRRSLAPDTLPSPFAAKIRSWSSFRRKYL